jgi:nitrite reductase/ring-hydroxylating ferredoxin subunit
VSSSLNGAQVTPDGATPLADLAAIADGGLVAADAVIDGTPESLILHRDGPAVRAWLNICPHAGRRLDWSPGQFLKSRDGLLVCAVHGASFELREGACVAGPCRGDRLNPVALEVRDGQVFLAAQA